MTHFGQDAAEKNPVRAQPFADANALNEDVVTFARDRMHRGERVCIVTLVGVEGSTPRAVGAQMAISETGVYVGYLSGGCIEAAVATEAIRVIEAQKNELIRFGRGSKFIDIVLPCGSGLDLFFDLSLGTDELDLIARRRQARQPTLIATDIVSGSSRVFTDVKANAQTSSKVFHRSYLPETRLFVAGEHPAAHLLKDIAAPLDMDVIDLPLRSLPPHNVTFDTWTALAILSHDHDQHHALLTKALQSSCFYVGVLGSHETQLKYRQQLRSDGFSNTDINRLHAPIGMIPSTKSAQELAVSVLAEVVDAARAVST